MARILMIQYLPLLEMAFELDDYKYDEDDGDKGRSGF